MENMSSFSNSKKSFVLMNKDTRILEFEEVVEYGETSFIQTNKLTGIVPFGFTTINAWVTGRRAPKHRKHIEDLLVMCGSETLTGFLEVTYALSLNDTFWVKEIDSSLRWNEVSLYSNKFDETIAKIAFEGGLHGINFTKTSPEFSTDGTFAKCWINEYDGKISLIKVGTTGAANAGLEPYSEFYSAQIASIICEDTVDYTLVKHNEKIVSSCKLFTDESEGLVQIWKMFEYGKPFSIKEALNFYNKIGSESNFRRMLVLDALILNTDRHAGNYGAIYDNDTMQIKRMAPVFDNNLALLPYAMGDDLDLGSEYITARTPCIGDSFIGVAKEMLTKEIRKDLINMKGFKFERHPKYNLPEARLIKLEKIVNNQIKLILE